MKKLFLVMVVALFAFQTQAQNLDLGIKVGANFANMNDASHVRNKTGLQAGAFVKLGFGKFALQPEVLYSQQGAKTDLGDFDLDYINVPVMFKYYLIGSFFNVQVGPQFGFLTHHSFKDQVSTKDFDLAGSFGLGVDLPLGLSLDARYNVGFTKVTEHEGGKNGVFSLAVGYRLF